MMTAAPSCDQVTPRIRAPIGSSTSFRNGTAAPGSANQTVVGRFVFCAATARRRPSGDHASSPFVTPELMLGACAVRTVCGVPSGVTKATPVNEGPVVAGSRYAIKSLVGDQAGSPAAPCGRDALHLSVSDRHAPETRPDAGAGRVGDRGAVARPAQAADRQRIHELAWSAPGGSDQPDAGLAAAIGDEGHGLAVRRQRRSIVLRGARRQRTHVGAIGIGASTGVDFRREPN